LLIKSKKKNLNINNWTIIVKLGKNPAVGIWRRAKLPFAIAITWVEQCWQLDK
jgi:hypothetical protein